MEVLKEQAATVRIDARRVAMERDMSQHFRGIGLLFLSMALLGGISRVAQAQQGSVIPIPFVTNFAGLPAGTANTQCSASIVQNGGGASLGDGCPANQATLTTMFDTQVDSEGNVYVSEQVAANDDIRVIYKGGTALLTTLVAANPQIANFSPVPGNIYTLAGGPTASLLSKGGIFYCNNIVGGIQALDNAGNGCPAGQAFLRPRGFMIDAYGDIITTNIANKESVRVIYAGGPQMAKLISLENPGLTTPKVGYIYQIVGGGAVGTEGDGGLAYLAGLVSPRYIALDSQGNIYVSDGNTTSGTAPNIINNSGNNIREINIATGIITTVAGETTCAAGYVATAGCPYGSSGDGGPATSALLNSPFIIFTDRFDNLYIADYYNLKIRVVYRGGTLAGITNPTPGYIYTYIGGGTLTADGTLGNQVQLNSMVNVAGIDKSGNIYVLDGSNKYFWRFDAVSNIGNVIAGTVSSTGGAKRGSFCSGTSEPISTDNQGDGCPSLQTYIIGIGSIAFEQSGDFYLATSTAQIQKLSYNNHFAATPVGTPATQYLAFKGVQTVTLTGENYALQGASTAEFSDVHSTACTSTTKINPKAVCVFNVAFNPSHPGLRRGSVSLTAGGATVVTQSISGIGQGSLIAVDPGTITTLGSGLTPSGVAVDLLGNVYVADTASGAVLKGTLSGTTLTPLVTGLSKPSQVALDDVGNLYIADTGNNRILVTTGAGANLVSFEGLAGPKGVVVDEGGNIYVADTGNNRVLRMTLNKNQMVVPFTGLSTPIAAPTQLALDNTGNLYLIDSGNGRIVVNTVAAGTTTAVAIDPSVVPATLAVDAAGDIYVTDSSTGSLLVYPAGVSAGNPLISGLTSPAGIAVDADANIVVADTGSTGVAVIRRSSGGISLPNTNLGDTSNASISLSDVGNTALSFPSLPLTTQTGSTLFTVVPATTNGCGAGIPFAPGSGCNFIANFSPTVATMASATEKFNTNAVNTATVNAVLSGQGKALVPTTTAIAPPPGNVFYYSQSANLTVTLTPRTTTTAPTGYFIVTQDGRQERLQMIGNGTYLLSLSLEVGSHAITVTYSGDSIYASSEAAATVVVQPAPTTTVLSVVPLNNSGLVSLLFTATVNATTAVGQTGTVTFYAGTTPINATPIAIDPTTYTATFLSSALSFSSSTLTAVYSGSPNGNFAGSTSTAIQTAGGDFAVGSASPTFTVPQGGIGTLAVTLTPLFGGTGTITSSCSGLPANSVCRFAPNTITLNGPSVPVSVQIFTDVPSTLALNHWPLSGSKILLSLGLPLGLGFFAMRRGRTRTMFAGLLALVLMTTMGLSGCGSGVPNTQTFSGLVTPAGTYNVVVTFTGSNGLSGSHSATANFIVTVDVGPY